MPEPRSAIGSRPDLSATDRSGISHSSGRLKGGAVSDTVLEAVDEYVVAEPTAVTPCDGGGGVGMGVGVGVGVAVAVAVEVGAGVGSAL